MYIYTHMCVYTCLLVYIRVAEKENLKTVPVPTFYLITDIFVNLNVLWATKEGAGKKVDFTKLLHLHLDARF